MKDINTLKDKFSEYCNYISYDDIKELLSDEFDFIYKYKTKDWQGETYYIVKRKTTGEYGFLSYSWGSCTICDMLQACSNITELTSVVNKIYNDIVWFDNKDDIIKWMEEKDWLLDCDGEEKKKFAIESISVLKSS